MPDRTFRIFSQPPAVDSQDRGDVEREIARLRALLSVAPGRQRVAINANPSGILGVYVSLLLDAASRGVSRRDIFPATVLLRYGRKRWFVFAKDVQAAFVDSLAAGVRDRSNG